MKTTSFRVVCLALALLSPATFFVRGALEPSGAGHRHLSGLAVRITMADGTSRVARLEGVGCSVGMCSRTLIKAGTDRKTLMNTWLDSIAAIRSATADDALFVLKDGTERRLSLVAGYRVLYLAGMNKLDLATVKSVEFIAPPAP